MGSAAEQYGWLDHTSSQALGVCIRPSEAHSIEVPRGDLREGERVRISVPPADVCRSIVILLLLPMVLAVAGLLIGVPYRGLTAAGGAVAGLMVASAIALPVNRRLARKSAYRP